MNETIRTLRQSRISAGLSQLEVARRSGISLATIQNIEAGRANPELKTLEALSETLGLKMELRTKAPDWQALAALGCPLLVENVPYTPHRAFLAATLEALGSWLPLVAKETREENAVLAWLCALRDHYPSIWKAVPDGVRERLNECEMRVSPKLRRLALEKLGHYL